MRVIFFRKMSKIEPQFRKCKIKLQKVFSFWDNCMWMGSIKKSLLGREHLITAFIVLRNSLKLSHITKRDYFQLNCLPVYQLIWYRSCRSNSNIVQTGLPCSFWKGNLKRDFLHIYLTTFFPGRSLRNK